MSDQETSMTSPAEAIIPDDTAGIPVEWYVPDTVISRYATNLVVQRNDHETIISFFELPPPLVIGTPDEVKAHLQTLHSVRAVCVARVIIANGRTPDFLRVIQGIVQARNEEPGEEG